MGPLPSRRVNEINFCLGVMKRPLPTIDQEAFSSLFLTQKLTRSDHQH